MKKETILVAVLAVVLFGVAGQFGYEDAKREEATYCENVKAGVWPDYQQNYEQICKGN